jgi:hypothetical protein
MTAVLKSNEGPVRRPIRRMCEVCVYIWLTKHVRSLRYIYHS